MFVFTFGFNKGGQADKTLAEVGSHKISAMEYREAYSKALAHFADKSDEGQMKLKEMVMNELVDKYVLLEKAREMGIGVSDREFAENLAGAGIFNTNGKFDRRLYLEFLKRNNLDLKTFEEGQRQAMTIGRMMSIIQDNSVAGMDEKAAYENYLREKGQVKLFVAAFNPNDFKDKVNIDEKEMADLYEREKGALRSDNTIDLTYMVIDDKSGVRDDQAYMDLLKSKDLAAYAKSKVLS